GLERDMQETWAIQGVYPGMAWTPDSKSVVFWAGGFIQRADLTGKQVYKIPFHVKDTRKTASAVRFPVDVLTGVLAAAASPASVSKAITDKPGHYYEPVFSPDGTRIVYRKSDGGYLVSTAWSADPGLYQVPAAGGKSTLITEDGSLPRFGKASDRVFFVKTE